MAAQQQDHQKSAAQDVALSAPAWVARAYAADKSIEDDPFEPAQTAYAEALVIFKETLTKDPIKKGLVEQMLSTSTLDDVINCVLEAKKESEKPCRTHKLRECVEAFAQRVLHYGNIMDVLVQHHPEFVSLAWGAMRFIFGAVVEHERTAATVVTALCDIADALPSVEVSLALFPTPVMKHCVSTLYAHIVRFLIRALQYFQESSVKRAVHTVTRPSALRYDDLVQLIRRDVEKVRRHAATSSQAEIRDLHHSIRTLSSQLERDRETARAERMGAQAQMATFGDFMTQIRVEISEVQVRQALSMISSQCSIDHKSALFSATQMSRAPSMRQRFKYNGSTFWTSSQMQAWNRADTSSSILLKSTFHQRCQTRNFCAEVVENLLRDKVAVFWIFMSRNQEYSLLEMLKSLVFQALSLDYATHTDSGLSFELNRYVGATFEEEYLSILGDLLQRLRHVYIIANSEAMSPSTAAQCRTCLQRLSSMLSQRRCQTVLKVITTSYGPAVPDEGSIEDFVLRFDATKTRSNHSRARKRMRRRQAT
ncbi:hypothetical protein GGR57DRAFT_493694 [Xylariaceae sp. FL1272]|nr:hypothetical protein GGR57DRAFT_493694 [Xylariaceae sp. FL1272]